MKTKFFALVALVLGMASCTKDFAPETNVGGGEVDFTLRVSAPELATTRAGEYGEDDGVNGHNSAYGAIDYLSAEDWSNADLRYILEVYDYDATGEYSGVTPIKDRQVQIVGEYAPVTFDLRLVQGRKYHFVVFADFVPQGASADLFDANYNDLQAKLGKHHIIGETLADIKVKRTVEDGINNEFTDAYFGSVDYTPDHQTHNTADPIVLTRPYAKVRVVATDLNELNINVEPKSVEVKYYSSYPTAFNALNGNIAVEQREVTEQSEVIFTDVYNDGVSKEDLSKHYYNEGYDKDYWKENDEGVKRHTHMTLFTDYILAKESQESVQFTMTVRDAKNGIIKSTDFLTEIPVQRNHLTTIIGNVLTTATEVKVSINDNFVNEVEQDPSLERILLETLINGGKFTLTEDLTLTAPHYLEGTVECNADAVIDLNGYTLKYVIPSDVTPDVANKYAIFVRVMDNASLTFVGEGEVVSDGYIASVNEGGELNISDGYFKTNSCTVFQSNGGEINITGGEFEAAPYNGDHRYTINFVDAKKKEGLISISGGRFYKYNPSESNSEVPAMDFCANGFWGVEDGEYYKVVAKKNFDLFVDHAEVYTAEGLLQWAYIVNNGAISAFDDLVGYNPDTFDCKAYGLEVMANIKMPAKTIKADADKETYVFTDEVITVTDDGVPSGSNWIPVCGEIVATADTYTGWVDGLGKTISGLLVNKTTNYAGFIGFMFDGVFVKDLTFSNAYVKGANYVGVVAGRAQDGTLIENVRVVNSSISGTETVGALVGYNYSRVGGAQGQGYAEGPAIIRNCSNDVNTKVVGTSDSVGGIAGNNYGATIINCHNYADVTGRSSVGGIVGYTRDYHHNKDGYIVACTTYPEAAITAKNGNAGGIAGYTLADNQHTNTYMHIVACTSLSNIVGKTKGCIIGQINHGQHTAGCVAVKNGATVLYGKNKPTTESGVKDAILYDAVGSATQADIDALNHAIDHYNGTTPPAESVCTYRWALVDGFPVIQ